MYTVLVFTLIGFSLLSAEVLFSSMILGVLGLVALLTAMVLGYTEYGPVWGSWIFSGVGMLCSMGFLLWLRVIAHSPLGKCISNRESLSSPLTSSPRMIGVRGVALSALRPTGVAFVEGKRRDVISDGSFIAAGSSITVIAENGQKLIVQASSCGKLARAADEYEPNG
ncbi:MAG: NfeD family protein [Candidatus Xiphinematobacter sp.]|nr:MAG: NfeD family protein [Candidatus Xiphinematobacter sp.]QQY10734.1 MAG: NfeD family protein [Candidatus Xiphinematobacter sp.]